MPIVVDIARANFRLVGPEWEPTGPAWARAREPQRRAYRKRLGELAVEAKRRELRAGKGVDGKKFSPRKWPRPDHAGGPPLSPHRAQSRFQRLLAFAVGAAGVTLFWRGGWAKVVGAHAFPRNNTWGKPKRPVRNAVGLTATSEKWVREQALLWWANRHPARGGTPPRGQAGGPEAASKAKAEAAARVQAEAEALARSEAAAKARAEAEAAARAQAKAKAKARKPRETAAERRAREDAEINARIRQRYLDEQAAKDARTAAAIAAATRPGADLRTLVDPDLYRDDWKRRNAITEAYVRAHASAATAEVLEHGMTHAEVMRTVAFQGHRVHFAATEAGIEQAAEGIGFLLTDRGGATRVPEALMPHARDIYFTRQQNKDDAYWAERYNTPGFTSGATGGGGDGKLVYYGNNVATWKTIIHEAGHNFARVKYGDTNPPRHSNFRQAGIEGEAPPTDYGKNSPAEDFAESVQLFARTPEHLRAIAPRRYAVVRKLMEDPGYGG